MNSARVGFAPHFVAFAEDNHPLPEEADRRAAAGGCPRSERPSIPNTVRKRGKLVKSHPPRSRFARVGFAPPFLRKGEDKHARGQHKRSLATVIAAALLVFTASNAVAAIGPNIRAVQPDDLTHYWVMTNTSLNVDVPNSGVNLDKPTCSAVTYMIGSDGVTRDIVVRKTVPAGDLAFVAKSAVKDMFYEPGADNTGRQPVFTYIIIPFNLPSDPAARKRITNACVLKDFPQGYR